MEQLYSRNLLVNGNAETGTTLGWTTQNATVVEGGTTEDGQHAFKLEATGHMLQQITIPYQPPDFLIGVAFLPHEDPDDTETEAKAKLEITLNYTDGSSDIIVAPCRADVPKEGV